MIKLKDQKFSLVFGKKEKIDFKTAGSLKNNRHSAI